LIEDIQALLIDLTLIMPFVSVWKDTAELGCAVATCTASQMGMDDGGSTKSDFVVCQYKAPGNVQGLFK